MLGLVAAAYTPCRSTFLSEWLSVSHRQARRLLTTSTVLHRSESKARISTSENGTHRTFEVQQKRPPWAAKPMIRGKPSSGQRNSVDNCRTKLGIGLYRWVRLPSTKARFMALGIAEEDVGLLLDTFLSETPKREGGWFPAEEDEKWQMDRIRDNLAESLPRAVDLALSNRFFAWALETLPTRGIVDASVLHQLAAAREALDYSHPAEWYPAAREIRRRVHMHVGPTNSGKTHNALRALAAAKTGIYASPLRLLAHEVYHRLNNGKILPLGADPSDPPELHKRPCNMVTGEEVRSNDPLGALVSCTIEMLSLHARVDVAVIDEIQMISDPERGGAWTSAVLGANASEVHLCGEEAAVPLVQKLLEDTGDEVVVHRYDRLTPLKVADESLNGDFTKIKKGDCVVTFSRFGIFGLKKIIEEKTGLKCAVVYGRLPPEVRSEQASLFNDPDSGYDVLIGSDAIGMGLNLKIKRVIFETVHKFNGHEEVPLSFSQMKQIGGRAGRYGLHGESNEAGIVTTLHEADLDLVRRAMQTKTTLVAKRAILPSRADEHRVLEQLLPEPYNNSFTAIFDMQATLASLAPHYRLRSEETARKAAEMIDTLCRTHTLEERMTIFNAPVQWRDPVVEQGMLRFLKMYNSGESVDVMKVLTELRLDKQLNNVQELMKAAGEPESSPTMLNNLESLYRVVIIYMWFSLRYPMFFNQREIATDVKTRCQEAIEWCLAGIKNQKGVKKTNRRPTEGGIQNFERLTKDPSGMKTWTLRRIDKLKHPRGDESTLLKSLTDAMREGQAK